MHFSLDFKKNISNCIIKLQTFSQDYTCHINYLVLSFSNIGYIL